MNFAAAFYLYILPVMISAIVLGWMMFDKWRDHRRKHLHPGE